MRIPFTILIITTGLLLLSGLVQSFRTEPASVYSTHPLKQYIPEGFPEPVYTFNNNPLTQEGFELGRKLFYDGRLSKDGNTACASCHQQFAAFSDYEHVFSHGFQNRFTLRNAPPLFNLAWHTGFHLDGGINHLEVQPLAPITDTNEMNERIENVIYKLKRDTTYRRMFKTAFGDEKINSQRILRALAQFTGTFVSAGSKYDRVKKGLDTFNAHERRGYEIFQARCASCHKEPLFSDFSYRNIGLPVDTFLYDYGRMRITSDPNDSLKFKVPSLRNIALTAPYMHDGRFWGLTTAINHFESQDRRNKLTDSVIARSKPLELPEVQFLVFFLHTLTDSSFLNDKNLVDPAFTGNIHM